ncbi:hypothetical protein [Sulfuracidifex tepidarius]|uniref:Uncharacterized protein n=1 Tax=Sulfuracidifex tepidarius TaxID=1294262 RepID=A0A510E203_9CREN|nr:hypothetical protein [Sulfuracidifex tepidarius]BBG23770.1 hypothetical protein IC006_1064 [Sulfuracidifex tepidarius]BBG26523.1 hypothetical protein IC007_1037 [Sulfuracidifex tepidarius]
MVVANKVTDEQKKILERMRDRVGYIINAYKEYLDALAEFDRTGVLKIHGKVLYVRKYIEQEEENKNKRLNLQ